jgi:hypothetical protein
MLQVACWRPHTARVPTVLNKRGDEVRSDKFSYCPFITGVPVAIHGNIGATEADKMCLGVAGWLVLRWVIESSSPPPSSRPPCSWFWFLVKLVLLQVIRFLNIYQHAKCHGPTLTGASFSSASEVWTSTIAISKGPSKKMMIQIKLVVMSIIFHCTKLICLIVTVHELSSIKQNVNFNIQPPATFVLFVSRKIGLIRSYSTMKIYQHTKCHGPTLTAASSACTAEV